MKINIKSSPIIQIHSSKGSGYGAKRTNGKSYLAVYQYNIKEDICVKWRKALTSKIFPWQCIFEKNAKLDCVLTPPVIHFILSRPLIPSWYTTFSEMLSVLTFQKIQFCYNSHFMQYKNAFIAINS